jgi:putative transposase
MSRVITSLQRLKDSCLDALSSCFARWTKPIRTSLPLSTLTDLGKSKSQLIAENALFRQQLIVLRRQVKRPTFTRTDRILLVLLVRLVRTWQQALLVVQPDTRLALASGALPSVLEAKIKDRFPQAESSRRNHRFDQGDGGKQSALGC